MYKYRDPLRKSVDAWTLLAVLGVLVGFLVMWSYRWDVIESFAGFYERREIEPGLWIGSMADSKDMEFVESHNIRLIVNCTYNLPRHFKGDRNIAYVTVPVRDNRVDVPKMTRHLPEAVATIQKHRRRGDAVLIHCFAGISRSATVCAAYLMAENDDMTVPEAIQYIRDRKPETFGPRPVFRKSLDDFHTSLVEKK